MSAEIISTESEKLLSGNDVSQFVANETKAPMESPMPNLTEKKENSQNQTVGGDVIQPSETTIDSSEINDNSSSTIETDNTGNDNMDSRHKETSSPQMIDKSLRSLKEKRRFDNRGFNRITSHQQYLKKNGNDSRGENENRSSSLWGHRTNLVDKNGRIQRVTLRLKNYVAIYKAKYFYYFDLVNGRYPQFVRRLDNEMEIWRMSFNIYASGFSNLIAHLGEIHAFYQMELVNKKLKWVYKDFNFYPNKMRYGLRVSSYDIADIYSRFIKFVCMKENILNNFPNVNINHQYYIRQRFEENVEVMKNRLKEVSVIVANNPNKVNDETIIEPVSSAYPQTIADKKNAYSYRARIHRSSTYRTKSTIPSTEMMTRRDNSTRRGRTNYY